MAAALFFVRRSPARPSGKAAQPDTLYVWKQQIAQLQRRAIEFATSGDFGPDSLAANLELARLAPDNEGAWTRLSRCYMEGGLLEEATGALDSVLAFNPRNSIARSLKIEIDKRRVSLLPIEPKVKATRVRATKRVRVAASAAPAQS